MIGLGRMGGNMTIRLEQHGHDVKSYDPGNDARTAASLAELRDQLDAPRAFWLMIPAGKITEDAFQELLVLGDAGDTIVDGGNSNFRESQRRYRDAQAKGIHFVDCGTSGGIWGLKEGYSLMIGGDERVVEALRPLFEALAPAPDQGWGRVGPVGAGHFTKMIHNGIEYGMMAAIAEGLNILKHADFGTRAHEHDKDAETTPLRHPEHYQYDFNLADITELWRRGSVVSSWLLDLTAQALAADPGLDRFGGQVSDSGEGRWTVAAANDLGVPAHVLTASLFERFASRDLDLFQNQVLSAMRFGFGGHLEKKK
jgi:6-phosphogluconate dehydrogenase